MVASFSGRAVSAHFSIVQGILIQEKEMGT
jgi:hypothetical protein